MSEIINLNKPQNFGEQYCGAKKVNCPAYLFNSCFIREEYLRIRRDYQNASKAEKGSVGVEMYEIIDSKCNYEILNGRTGF